MTEIKNEKKDTTPVVGSDIVIGEFRLYVIPDVSEPNIEGSKVATGSLIDIGRDGVAVVSDSLTDVIGHQVYEGTVTQPVPRKGQQSPIASLRFFDGGMVQTNEVDPSNEPLEVAQRPQATSQTASKDIAFRGSRRAFVVKIISRDSIEQMGLQNMVAPSARKKAA